MLSGIHLNRGHLQTVRGVTAAVTKNKWPMVSGAVGRWGVNALPVLQAYMHPITHFVIKLGNASENFKKYHVGIADTAIAIVDTASHLAVQKHLLDYWYSPTLIKNHIPCPQVYLILKGIKFLMKVTYSS